MDPKSRIYVAGHRGLVGSALVRGLEKKGFARIIRYSHAELDLTDQAAVRAFFNRERPEYVFLAAAKVGGIHANNTYPAEFIHQNLIIQDNVIHSSWQSGVQRLLFLGSSCIFPRECPQPMKEEYLLTGPLEPTNESYAVAKIAGIKLCQAYNRQYGTRFISVMPTNLYGPNDNYHPLNSHVLPALIRRFHEAKTEGHPEVTAWGTGAPRREFLYSEDMADACVYLMNRYEGNEIVNIGCGQDRTISELTELVAATVGYKGQIVWDHTKPDGMPRKLLDVTRLHGLGWNKYTPIETGLALAYRDYLENQNIKK